jgi:hypothetical protein
VTRLSAIAVVAGALGALLLLAALRQSVLGMMVGAMLSPLPLAMVVFSLGASFLPVAVVSGVVTMTVMTGSFPFAIVYLAMDAAPVAILSRLGLAAMEAAGKPIAGLFVGRTVCALALVAFAAPVSKSTFRRHRRQARRRQRRRRVRRAGSILRPRAPRWCAHWPEYCRA